MFLITLCGTLEMKGGYHICHLYLTCLLQALHSGVLEWGNTYKPKTSHPKDQNLEPFLYHYCMKKSDLTGNIVQLGQ